MARGSSDPVSSSRNSSKGIPSSSLGRDWSLPRAARLNVRYATPLDVPHEAARDVSPAACLDAPLEPLLTSFGTEGIEQQLAMKSVPVGVQVLRANYNLQRR